MGGRFRSVLVAIALIAVVALTTPGYLPNWSPVGSQIAYAVECIEGREG